MHAAECSTCRSLERVLTCPGSLLSRAVDESRGEKQQEEEISHWMHLQ